LPMNFMQKNRYPGNVLAPDSTRVPLRPLEGIAGSDYINANFITDEFTGERAYIVTQGPMPNTIPDFWRMVFEHEVRVIVMLTKEIEKSNIKCARYWPESGLVELGLFNVRNIDSAPIIEDELIRRQFELIEVSSGIRRVVTQFQYVAWPDHGLPVSPRSFILLSDLVDDANMNLDPSSKGILLGNAPILIHCSAGIGRSGTFCAVHQTMKMMRQHFLLHLEPPPLNLVNTILHMRKQRPGMVQVKDQFIFCYLTILEDYKRLSTEARLRKEAQARAEGRIAEDEKESSTSTPPLSPSLALDDSSRPIPQLRNSKDKMPIPIRRRSQERIEFAPPPSAGTEVGSRISSGAGDALAPSFGGEIAPPKKESDS